MKHLVSTKTKYEDCESAKAKARLFSEDKAVRIPGKLKRIGLFLADIFIDLIEFFIASI